jgi:signal transduction histidine kinase
MRRWKIIRKIQSSIFIKLLLIFVSVSFATVILIYYILDYLVSSPDRELAFRIKNRVHYAELLVQEMGTPPDPAIIRRIAHEQGITISIEGGGVDFKTDPTTPSVASIREHALKTFHVGDAYTGLAWNKIYLVFERGPSKYLFLFPYDPLLRARPNLLSALIAVVLLLLLATFLFTRKLLRPLKRLHEGVQEISEGHLNHRVPSDQSDEFGDLARSFNRMSDRIREMIEAKEQLLLDVSHELRSPLARISVAAEIPGSGEVIRKNVKEMDSMIAELLESARMGSSNGALRFEKADLSQLILETAAKFEGEPPGVRVLSLPKDMMINLDPGRIRSVLRNVIENAIKYSPKDRKPVEISYEKTSPNTLEVIIEDFGIGISEREQSLVFGPFYRVDKSRCKEKGGYGLGLSLCKKIMAAHGGDLKLRSVLNQGTRMSIVFNGVFIP